MSMKFFDITRIRLTFSIPETTGRNQVNGSAGGPSPSNACCMPRQFLTRLKAGTTNTTTFEKDSASRDFRPKLDVSVEWETTM